MLNKVEEIVKGIDSIIGGLEVIKKAFIEDEKEMTMQVEKELTQEEQVTTEVSVGDINVEELKAMKYNEFKKYAASLGVKCTGTRDEIMERILALDSTETESVEDNEEVVEEDTTTPTTPVEEEVPVKSDKLSSGKKFNKKQADEPTRDEYDEQAEEIISDTDDVKEIIEALADVGIKATKRNVAEKLAHALRENILEFGDDDEEEVVEAEVVNEEVEDEDEEINQSSYFQEYDPKGYNNPEEMSEERTEAVLAMMDEILEAYSEGALTDDDIASYVEDNATEEEIELLGEEYDEKEILKLYMELIKRTIDNEGEQHEMGEPYEVADKDVCCGHELKYIKKTKKYVCEHCGEEYEAE